MHPLGPIHANLFPNSETAWGAAVLGKLYENKKCASTFAYLLSLELLKYFGSYMDIATDIITKHLSAASDKILSY